LSGTGSLKALAGGVKDRIADRRIWSRHCPTHRYPWRRPDCISPLAAPAKLILRISAVNFRWWNGIKIRLDEALMLDFLFVRFQSRFRRSRARIDPFGRHQLR